jgi:silicon transporter
MSEGAATHYHGVNTPLDKIRIAISTVLVTFSVVVVLALIATGNTQFARDIHPAAAGIILWVLIIWMSMVEGGQCSMVGLPPVDRELYRESHPITYKITGWGHKGDNLDRYLMGRQFMVIFINFTIGLCGAPIDASQPVLGLPQWVITIFLGSGIAMVLQNVIIGQLTSQVNASHCMLDYINTHFMTFTYWVAAGIEVTGVMHTSYLIRMMAYWAAGKPVESNEPTKTGATLAFYWGRILFSVAILGFALAVTIDALFRGQTTIWAGVPNIVGLIAFLVLMSCVGLLEGMQIAFFTVAKLPKSERGDSSLALKTCDCLFRNGGKNLPGFMCGRQMTVTLCFFVIARVTTINVEIGVDENIFGVSDWVQTMFNLGFMGALTTTILGSIAWQLVASSFPIEFLSNPVVYLFLQAALLIQASGICSAAWLFAVIQRKAMGFQLDEVYVGTPEERAAKGYADDEEVNAHLDLGTNLTQHAVGRHTITREYMDLVQESFANQREKVMDNISELREHIKLAETDEEKKIFEDAMKLEIDALKSVNKRQSESIRDLGALMGDDNEDDVEAGVPVAAAAAVPVKDLEADDDL